MQLTINIDNDQIGKELSIILSELDEDTKKELLSEITKEGIKSIINSKPYSSSLDTHLMTEIKSQLRKLFIDDEVVSLAVKESIEVLVKDLPSIFVESMSMYIIDSLFKRDASIDKLMGDSYRNSGTIEEIRRRLNIF